MLEWLGQEVLRRPQVVRMFTNVAGRLRLVRAAVVETHEEWIEGTHHVNMDMVREDEGEQLKVPWEAG